MRGFRAPFLAALLSLALGPVRADERIRVDEGWQALRVTARAPIPEEVSNETQARALSREAAVIKGQTALLTYVLQKRAHSKKTLAEAEIPSVPLQQHIRGYIKGARVVKTTWGRIECSVTLVLDKSELKSILRRN